MPVPQSLLPTLASLLLLVPSPFVIFTPVSFSKPYIDIETPQAVFYCRQLGIRNLISGLAIARLTYEGNLSGAATVMKCYPLLGILDAWAGWMYRGRLVKNDVTHVVVGALFWLAGVWVSGSL
jgi:hypothetical protein